MEWTSRHLILALIIILAVITGEAKSRPKMFPADHGSIALENRYADEAQILRFQDRRSVERASEAGELVPIPINYNSRLPRFRRYLRPSASEFVSRLDEKFRHATGGHLLVDSAVRPADTQAKLARWNRNAAPANGERASSHERGTTFDLSRKMRRGEYRWLLIQLAYFQAIGKIHVIEERHCLHVMVREDRNAGLLSDSRSLEVVSLSEDESMDSPVGHKVDAETNPEIFSGQPTASALPWEF